MKSSMDINCDMGESFGNWNMGNDEGMMPRITTANVACGFHASDPLTMLETVKLAKKHKVEVGSHPGLPDLLGFGRRAMNITPEDAHAYVVYQTGALQAALRVHGMRLHHIKPHGALYGMATRDDAVANAICDVAQVFEVPLFGMAGTVQDAVYRSRGVPFVSEFYADLDYNEDGMVIITREHEAVEPRASAARVLRAIEQGKVKSVAGTDVSVKVETICVHSDTPGAVAVASAVRETVKAHLR